MVTFSATTGGGCHKIGVPLKQSKAFNPLEIFSLLNHLYANHHKLGFFPSFLPVLSQFQEFSKASIFKKNTSYNGMELSCWAGCTKAKAS